MSIKKIIIFSIFIFIDSYANKLNYFLTDTAVEYRFNIPMNTYHKYCKNIYSQNGEDGIIEQLFKELNIKKGVFCEFGASDGIASSNTYNLIKNHDFSGIAIEADENFYKKCVENYRSFSGVQVYNGFVMYDNENYNLDAWLKKGNLASDFDLLSIDIDCDDYYVWKNLTNYNPKIVILETNSYRDPVFDELPRNPSNEYNIDLLREWKSWRIAQGCSFISAVKLGLEKGYIPVAYTGNIIFLRKDLVINLREFPYKVSDNPYDYITLYTHLVLWGDKWMTNTCLIFNVAVRDYYQAFKTKKIDLSWLNIRMSEVFNNDNVIF